jgi:UDP-N-acetylmuramoyl-L-alanyl-D-glutamate--2,6-diaminopimelate ligase
LSTVADRLNPVDELPARPVGLRRIRLSELSAIESLAGAARTGTDVAVTGVSSSSELVEPGDLFAALPGSSVHGARFVSAAVAAGAVAILTDPAGVETITATGVGELPCIVVTDPRRVLGPVSSEVYGHPSQELAVYGITGTSGKTTTTFLVRAGLQAAGRSVGLIGTVGVFVGDQVLKTPFTTPEAPQLQALLAVMVERGIREVGMEVSSHALRMGRADDVEFAVGGFTNLSQDHLDFHTDMEDYFRAKSMLFDGRARREVVVIDDRWGRRLVRPGTVTVSTTGPADWTATGVRVLADGSTRFVVSGPHGKFPAGCRIPGAYNVANSVLAFAVLDELGVDPASVAAAVMSAQVRGRMERVDGDQPFLAVVDYSHKPAGVSGALQALRALTSERLIIVLGCGGDRDRGKRPIMGEVAATEADVLIVTDDNPRSEDPAAIRAAMLAGARSVPADARAEIYEESDRRSAIHRAIWMARAGDTVLIAGKGHETGQQVGTTMLPFDDVSVVREALVSQGFHLSPIGPVSDVPASRVRDR